MFSRKWVAVLPLLLLCANVVHASERIVGVAIAQSGHVYAWFTDGKVTSGTRQSRRLVTPSGTRTKRNRGQVTC